MTRYVIGPDVAIHLAGEEAVIPDGHHMLAPALLRSQMLSLLYQAVHRGEMTKEDAEYVAMTQLEADALITLDRQLADAAKNLVTVAPIEALF
jgi:predicted nucleic acid-binding protein